MGRIPNSRKYTINDVTNDYDSNENIYAQSIVRQPLKKRLLKEYEQENLFDKSFKSPIKIVYEFESSENLELSMIRHFLVNSHEKYMKIIHEQLEQAKNFLHHNQTYTQIEISLSDTWKGLLPVVKRNIKTLAILASEMPVFKDFKEKELHEFIDQNFCTFFLVGP